MTTVLPPMGNAGPMPGGTGGADPGDGGDLPDYPEHLSHDLPREVWETMGEEAQRAWVSREQRFKNNRSEQIQRLFGDISERLSRVEAGVTSSNGNGSGSRASNGQSRDWESLSDDEVTSLYTQALDVQRRAQDEPDNEDLQRQAAQVTPQLLWRFTKEIARREAVNAITPHLEEQRKRESSGKQQQAAMAYLTAKLGQGVLTDRDLISEAQQVMGELKSQMGDEALTAAIVELVHARRNRGGGGRSESDRRRLAGLEAGASSARTASQAAALRAKGDLSGAKALELRDFLAGSRIGQLPRP